MLRPYVLPLLLLLLSALGLQAQNTLSTSPVTIFLNSTVGGPSVAQTFFVTSSPATGLPFSATFSNAPWLQLSAASGFTPANLTVSADVSSLPAGLYSTTVSLTSANAATASVVVVLTVNRPSIFISTPANLTFLPGSPAQSLSITTVNGSATPSFTPVAVKGPWLVLTPAGSSVNVNVNTAGLIPGQAYVDGVQIIAADGSALIVPVVLYFSTAPQISVTPLSMAFNYQVGGNNINLQQALTVSPGGAVFNATASVPFGTPLWFSVSPATGTGTILVTSQPVGLPSGTYQGSVIIQAVGGNTVTIPVVLTVSTQVVLSLAPTRLDFTYQIGGANPPDQSVTPTTSIPGLPYTVTATSQGNWLTVSAANPVTPNLAVASVHPAGLPAGTYSGTLTFNAPNASNNPQTVPVSLTVTTTAPNNPLLNTSPSALVFNYETGQFVPGAQAVTVTSTGPSLRLVVSTTGGTSGFNNWLLTGALSSSTTPAAFSVGINPTGLAPGVYNASIVVNAPDAAAQFTIPVTLNISNVALLNLPTSLSFSAGLSGNPQPQVVNVTSTGEAVSYLVSASTSTPPGFNWLTVGNPSGQASSAFASSFVVSANSSGLPAGVYNGSLLVHASNGSPDTTIPVTLTVSSGSLTVAPTIVNFTQAAGGPAPATQSITISSSGIPLTFSAVANTPGFLSWLSVNPAGGTTPANVVVSANGGNLPVGTYTGTISITSPTAGNNQTVTVTLAVTTAQNLTVTPASLSFASPAGALPPAPQTIGVTAPAGVALPFTVTSTATGGTNWLSVNPTTGVASQAATNLTVSANPQGLGPGTYTGTIVITAQGAVSQTVNVTFVVSTSAAPGVTSVQNAASGAFGPVAPGEIVSIFGSNLGPAAPVTTTVSAAGFFATTLGNVQVLFDSIPAAMWYASSTQINAIVPYEIAGRATTQMQVLFNGVPAAPLNLQVVATAPGIFTTLPSTQAAAFNQNGSLNGGFSPAPRGTTIVLFATGEGSTSPPGVTGRVIPVDPTQLKHPSGLVSVTIGGQPAEVQYAGSAPGLVSGAFQVNVLIPDSAPSGFAVPVVLTVGNASSQGLATIVVQ